MKKKLIYLLFSALIIICVLETQFDFIQTVYFGNNLQGETSLIQILQNLILLSNIFITIKFRKLLVKFYNKISYILRVTLVSIIFYEEISFITKGISDYLSSFNYQNEINLHNLNFMGFRIYFENIDLIFTNISFSTTLHFLFYSLILIFIGYGSYLNLFKRFHLFFLERRNSIYCLLYFFIELINSALREMDLTNGNPLLSHEMLELAIYILLFKDMIEKIKRDYKKN